MTRFTVLLAEVPIQVDALFDSTKDFCRDYLTDQEAELSVQVRAEDITLEHQKSARQRKREGLVPHTYPDSYLETLALYRKIVDLFVERDIILFHGSCLAVDNEAFLFTAPSGTGKSTHTRLWREHFGSRAVMVNDDKPLIKLTENGATIYGTPWMGKHGLGANVAFPLKTICHLRRGKTNHIEPMTFAQLYPTIMQQSQRPLNPELMSQFLTCLDQLGQAVDLYQLDCTISEEAVLLAHSTMKGN